MVMFKVTNLTEEDWKLFEEKFKKLMYTISRQVSGDSVTCELEDNYADLCVTAVYAINTFSKKKQEPFSNFINTISFSKYIKSCLWNSKNKKGSQITKKLVLYKNKTNIDDIYTTNHNEY